MEDKAAEEEDEAEDVPIETTSGQGGIKGRNKEQDVQVEEEE